MTEFLKSIGLAGVDWWQVLFPLVYVIVGIFLYKLLSGLLKLFIRLDPSKVGEENYQRLNTVRTIGSNALKYVIVFIVILLMLASYGVDVGSIFAGLGIFAAALGLALQDFAKDIAAGISILSENQFHVGDLIEIDGFRGRVIFLGLKTTKIRNYRGKVKIIANRKLDTVINYTQENTLAQIDIQVAYKHNVKDVEEALNSVKKRLDGTMEQMEGEIKILGITDMDNNGVTWRVNCPCKPYKHFAVQRALRREILEEFAARKIEIPYSQVTVHNAK